MESRLSALMEAAPVAIMLIDRAGKVRAWNAPAEQLTGYSAAEAVGGPPPLVGPEHHPDAENNLLKVFDGGSLRGLRVERRHKNGQTVHALLSAGPVRDAKGQVTGAMAIFTDIGAQLEIEQQLHQVQKMEAIGQLTGGLAHDFNNLLGVVIGNLDILSRRIGNNPEAQELFKDAIEAAERGADLTRSLLSFARRQTLNPIVLDLNATLPDVVKMLSRVIGETIEMRLKLADQLWLTRVDRAQFESAILNLAVNARDAMPDGGMLTIATRNDVIDESYASAHAEVTAGNYVVVAITDTGMGIPPDLISRVFEPFFTTKDVGKGSGLGLSMVFGFVKQSGGHVRLYSEVDIGTTIQLYLPRHSSPVEIESADRHDAVGGPVGASILVVEDKERLRRVVMHQLQDLGHNPIPAANAAEALAILATNVPIDLLFTDIVMPGGMLGPELALTARAMRPAIKVLFTSGFAEGALDRMPPSLVNSGFLQKPYRERDLARAVANSLLDLS